MSSGRRRRGKAGDPGAPGPDGRAETPQTSAEDTAEIDSIAQRHMRFGWWALLFFLTLGLFLESLHGFKVGWYLEVSSTMRRQMWTLAHAHGTLLAILNLILGATVHRVPRWPRRQRGLASASLLGAAVLLPMGFFIAGLFPYEGDPGLGILLVPVGGVSLWMAVFLAGRGWSGAR